MSKKYSHSKLSTYEQCPLKYKFRYIDKIKILEKSIEALLGSVVHNTFEWLYNEVKKQRVPTIDQTIEYYSNNWHKEYTPEIYIARKEMSEKDYFNKGIKFILDYYLKHQPFQEKTLETEKKVEIDLDENGEYKLIGYIDRLVENKDKIEIHDYKTANSLPSKDKIDTDRQLAVYSIAVKDQYGEDKEIHLIWHYLAFNKTIYSKRTNNQLNELKKEILKLIQEIESSQEFPSKKSVLCNWCEYKRLCPEFKNNQEKKINKNSIQTDLDKYPSIKKYIKKE